MLLFPVNKNVDYHRLTQLGKFYYNAIIWATSFGRRRPSPGPLNKSFEHFNIYVGSP